MKILVVGQHFYPEQFRINDICFSLAKRGHEVTMLTGLPNYPEGKIYPGYQHGENRDEWINGVHVIRCSLVGRGKNILQFGINYAWFAISGKLKAKELEGPYDIVFSYETSPVSMVAPAIVAKKKFHIPLIIDCLDQWPISVTAGPINEKSLFYKILYKYSVNIYKQADLITITSKSFESYFNNVLHLSTEKYGLKYWPQYAENIYAEAGRENNEVYDVLYAGNIGPAADVETIVKAAVKLKDKQNIFFHIVGDGMNREACEKIAKENQLDNIRFYGSYPVEKMKEFYTKADALLITMKDNQVVNYTLPAKMQSYMLSGKPIIGAINGETQRVIHDSKCGYCVNSGEYEKLANCILEASKDETDTKGLGKNAKKYYNQDFDKEKLLDELEEMMQETISKHRGEKYESK